MVINTIYLDNAIISKAREIYNNHSPKNICFQNFFQPAIFSSLQKKLYNSKFVMNFDHYKHKYLTTKSNEIKSFLYGRYFIDIVKNILAIKKFNIRYEIRKFSQGCYTLLHDSEQEKPRIDFIIDFSKAQKPLEGYIKYLSKERELLQINPSPNTLSFIDKKKGMMKYTKYVTHQQKEPIILVDGTVS